MNLFINNICFSSLIIIIKFFFLSLPLLKCSNTYNIYFINIPFYTKYENKSIITSYYYNDIYSKIDIGSNNQQIEMKLQLNNFPLYIVEKKSVDRLFLPYIPQDSGTYNSFSKVLFYDKDFISGTISTDYFIVDSKKINFKFVLASQMSYVPIIPPGSIGFGVSSSSSNKEKNINFIDQLKTNNIISGYSVSFIFNENDKGEILIGEDLDIIKKEFKNKLKIITKTGTNERQINWGFMFKNVELINNNNNISSFCNDDAIIDLSNEYIISNKAFTYSIKKIFFDKLIEEKSCEIQKINNTNYFNNFYRIIKCKKNINDYIIKNFPIIKFTLKDINSFSLNFTYEDLFFYKNDYIYFKIIIYHIDNENEYKINLDLCEDNTWVFGKILFKKYNITLNKDKKIIIFYFDNDKHIDEVNIKNNNENKNRNNYQIIIWILVFIMFLLGFALFHFIRKNFWLQNKINNKNRKNVLINEMEYFPQLNE